MAISTSISDAPPRGQQLEVVATGELDIATADHLAEALALAPQVRSVCLDLSEVTFLDSTALRVVIDASRRVRLRVVGASGHVRELFRLTGSEALLSV